MRVRDPGSRMEGLLGQPHEGNVLVVCKRVASAGDDHQRVGDQSLHDDLPLLEVQVTNSGNRIFACQPSRPDDLAISLALLVWAARHPHITEWTKLARPRLGRARSAPKFGSTAWT
ncbi:hypothetical protein [Mesorhizobium escarrei]|uniref:Acyl-CoA carboxylase subunit epsilon n=1 Tax=Mesorhizobium escarrei TaxID=666018 RepID=A0ABM9E0V6_9HYPH|nr:hypothetical protein [Mesorhizobium escarrei]CAH2402694.1 hypothetical protein MES5069_350006 [Mesorhizobium escarrei]